VVDVCPVEDDPCAGKATVPVPAAALGGPVSHAIFRVARLHRMMAGRLLRSAGLHPGQELVMMRLWEAGPQRQADLIKMVDCDAATMTRMIARLERAGFVRRKPCPADRRAAIIESTVAGAALRDHVERIWLHLEELTTAGLDDGAVLDVLRKLETQLAAAVVTCADVPPEHARTGPDPG
jgi:MarR family transcriptional regulator, organic hydroperoxide resistance regulator